MSIAWEVFLGTLPLLAVLFRIMLSVSDIRERIARQEERKLNG